jgi:DNA excision repair protein ERCC-5
LLGCDFTEGVRGIGPVNATEIVRHYAGLQGLRRFREWCDKTAVETAEIIAPILGEDPEDVALKEFKLKHANYRNQWVFPDNFPSIEVWNVFDIPVVSRDMTPFSWADPDERSVVEVVRSHTDMSVSQIESIMSTTMAKYKETRIQRRITDYFSPLFDRGSVAEVVSKRLKAALQ